MRRCAVLVIALQVLAVGCGSQVPGASAPLAVSDASHIDMCTVLSGRELSDLGAKLDTREPFNEVGVVGCRWVGKPFTLSLERDKDTLASYQARRRDPVFVSFVDNRVNGRGGAQLVLDPDGSQCAQLMDGGPVSLVVGVAASSSLGVIDSCAEALRIAKMIEPRLPKAEG